MEESVKQQAKDPFEVAFVDHDSPPESPVADVPTAVDDEQLTATENPVVEKAKEDEEEEEEENVDTELGKLPSGDPDKMVKMQAILSQFTADQMSRYESFRRSGFQKATMRRAMVFHMISSPLLSDIARIKSGRQFGHLIKAYHDFGHLLMSIAGCPISMPMTIVMSGIAKMFVGELVETARIVMSERKDGGPVRPTHIREAYRRLKLEGKIPRRHRSRLF